MTTFVHDCDKSCSHLSMNKVGNHFGILLLLGISSYLGFEVGCLYRMVHQPPQRPSLLSRINTEINNSIFVRFSQIHFFRCVQSQQRSLLSHLEGLLQQKLSPYALYFCFDLRPDFSSMKSFCWQILLELFMLSLLIILL